MATPAQSNMPFGEELGLVNYLRQATGTSQAAAGTQGKYTASQATASQAPLITQDGLSGIMTEFLRTNGQFLERMQQQNQSGMYNSSTRRLVANDLTAQAALKAATANQNIGFHNAQLSTQASVENARLSSTASRDSAKVKGPSSKDNLLNLLMAAGINKYRGDSEKDAKKAGKGQQGTRTTEPDALRTAQAEEFDASSAGSFGSQADYGYNSFDVPDTSSAAWAAEPFDINQMTQLGNGNDFSGMDDFSSGGFNFDSNLGNGAVYQAPNSAFDYQDYSDFDIGVSGGSSGGGGGSSSDFGDLFDWSEW